MSEDQNKVVSTFPFPPPYYRLFDPEKIKNEKYFVPPPKPIEGTYYMFGKLLTTNESVPSLKEQEITQLFPEGEINTVEQLKNLNKLLLQRFLQLIESLITKENQELSDLPDVSLVFKNMHYLINSYRPHQARQTLITLMEEQIKNRKSQIQTTKELILQSENSLNEAISHLEIEETLKFKNETEKTQIDLPFNLRKSSALVKSKEEPQNQKQYVFQMLHSLQQIIQQNPFEKEE